MATPDLTPNIQTNAISPRSAEVDGLRAEQQSISEQIKADVYLKAAARTRGLPMRVVRLVPGNNADAHLCGGNY
jgi:hypothetical protein